MIWRTCKVRYPSNTWTYSSKQCWSICISNMICVWSAMVNIDSWCIHWCIQRGQVLPKGGPYGTLTKYCYGPPPLSALTEFAGFTHGLSVGQNKIDIQVSYFVVFYVRQLLSHSYQPKTSHQSRP